MDLRPIFRKAIKIDSLDLPDREIDEKLEDLAAQIGVTTKRFISTLDWYVNGLELRLTISSKNLEDKLNESLDI